MAQVMFTGAVLEINSRPAKDNPNKVYHTLVMYELGKRYPDLAKISLTPDQLDMVSPAVGKTATIVAEMFVYQGRVSYQFRSFGKP